MRKVNKKAAGWMIGIIIFGIIGVFIFILFSIYGWDFFGMITNFVKIIPTGNRTQEIQDSSIIGYNLNDGNLYYFNGVEWMLMRTGLVEGEKKIFLNGVRVAPIDILVEFNDFIIAVGKYKNVREGVENTKRLTNGYEALYGDDRLFVPLGAYVDYVGLRYGLEPDIKNIGGVVIVIGKVGYASSTSRGIRPSNHNTADPNDQERLFANFVVYQNEDIYLEIWNEDGSVTEKKKTRDNGEAYEEKAYEEIVEISKKYRDSVFKTKENLNAPYIELLGERCYVELSMPYAFVRLNEDCIEL